MALFLRDEDIEKVVSMDDMLQAVEDMQLYFGLGEAPNVARRKIFTSKGTLSFLGGGLHYRGVSGVKTYTTVGGTHSFHVTLYDTATGRLLAFLQANRLGQLRTGATTGVATRHLARQDAGIVGILGTGYQAPTQLEAVSKVRKISRIKAYSRTPDGRQRFARELSRSLGIEIVPAATSREVVDGSDVVICITNPPEPVLDGDWLAEGALLVSAGPTSWRSREIDDTSLQRSSTIVVDSLEQAPNESGELASAADRGLIQWSQVLELRRWWLAWPQVDRAGMRTSTPRSWAPVSRMWRLPRWPTIWPWTRER